MELRSPRTALLLSGGIDSVSIAWWRRPHLGITVDYGQLPAEAEMAAARAVCDRSGIAHLGVTVDCRTLGSGDLAGSEPSALAPASDWWPFRNQLLVTLVAMAAVRKGVSHLLIGTVKSDQVHKDGHPDFISTLNELLGLQEGGLTVEAPAIHLSSAELVRLSGVPAGILAWAHSCHRSSIPCGACRGCSKYFEVHRELSSDLDRLGESISLKDT